MGQAKQQQIEDEGRGYYIPRADEKYICKDCIADNYLKKFIADNSNRGRCLYCKKRANVVDFSIFFQYIARKITKNFTNPDNANLPLASSFCDDDSEEIPGYKRVGCYIVPKSTSVYDYTGELLCDLDISENEELLDDISSKFINDYWIDLDPMVITKGEELSYSWRSFEELVKYSQRYTFFNNKEFSDSEFSSENGLQNILFELASIINTHKIISSLPKGSQIFRCRFLEDGKRLSSFEEMTSAPNDSAKQSRMSPAGISMFYGAFNSEDAVKESSPNGDGVGYCAIGEFKTTKELRLLDLTTLPELSFWNPDDYKTLGFLHSFSRIVSKRINRDDTADIEYIPTQVFTEHIRYSFRGEIDGVLYNSSLKGLGANVVLFYDAKSSEDILSLTNIEHKNYE